MSLAESKDSSTRERQDKERRSSRKVEKEKKIICLVTSQTFATDGLKWHLAVIKQSAMFRWPEKQATHLSKQS